jgi:hypothetical protein
MRRAYRCQYERRELSRYLVNHNVPGVLSAALPFSNGSSGNAGQRSNQRCDQSQKAKSMSSQISIS